MLVFAASVDRRMRNGLDLQNKGGPARWTSDRKLPVRSDSSSAIASGRFSHKPPQLAGFLARSRRKHAMHQLKVVVLGQKPLSRAVKEDRVALAVHYQYRLCKGLQDIRKDVYFATSGGELGAEFASALNPPQQGGQFVLILRVESWLIERP